MIGVQRGSSLTRRPFTGRNGERGTALIEFALVLPILIILLLVTVDFGRLIQARLIISNVSREGGSIAARQTTVDTSLTTVLKESGKPLNLIGADGKIIITRIDGGHERGLAPIRRSRRRSAGARSPGAARSPRATPTWGSPRAIYNHLMFKSANATVGHLGSHRGRGVLQVPSDHAVPEGLRRRHADARRGRHDRLEQGHLLGTRREPSTPTPPAEDGRGREGTRR